MTRSYKAIWIFTSLLFLISVSLSSVIVTQEQYIEDYSHVNYLLKFESYVWRWHREYFEVEPERVFRFLIWKTNYNALLADGQRYLENRFTDRTQEQVNAFRVTKLATVWDQTTIIQVDQSLFSNRSGKRGAAANPAAFDWRTYNVIGAVKDQGVCKASWSFSTTAFFEAEAVRRKISDNGINLAEQYLLQCDTKSSGCNGGLLQSAMDLAIAGGIPYQSQYPWAPTGLYDTICKPQSVFKISDTKRVSYYTNLNDDQIINLLLQRPLNVAVSSKGWQKYQPSSSLSKTYYCDPSVNNRASLDHTALLVGYTSSEWILKQQWGSNWGVGGYIYVARGSADCGIGWQVHTLDYALATWDTLTIPSATNVIAAATSGAGLTRTQIPALLECGLPNCSKCYVDSPDCAACKTGYQLNTLTRKCQKTIIPNCFEFKLWAGVYQCVVCSAGYNLISGSCASPGLNPPVIDANVVYRPDPFAAFTKTDPATCDLPTCSVCYNGGKQCYICVDGYAVDWTTKLCAVTPVANCNLFIRNYSIGKEYNTCFECRRGYRLQTATKCTLIPSTTTPSV